MIARALRRAAVVSLFVAQAVGCGAASGRPTTIVQDVVVRLDPPSERSPLEGPSARLTAAAREVRDLLGHPIELAIDAAIAPASKDAMDLELTRMFEALATELTKWQKRDPNAYALARSRLRAIAVRYDPTAKSRVSARFEGNGTVVVTKATKHAGDFVPVSSVLALLEDTAEGDDARTMASFDPNAVPPDKRDTYAKWLWGGVRDPRGPREDERASKLARIPAAARFYSHANETQGELVRRFLIDGVLPDLAYGHLGSGNDVDAASDTVAGWLERTFDQLSEAWRHRALETLLRRGSKNPRFVEPSIRLSTRVIDAWARAGHPLPSDRERGARDVEVVVCPHPKGDNDARSRSPNCDGGLVRLMLSQPNGAAHLGQLLAAKRDPVLTEHVMVSAGYSSYGGDARTLIALIRALETDPTLLRVALRVVAEEHADTASREIWVPEARRLWLARTTARGTLLYLLAHLDPYGNQQLDWDDFAGDYGAPVSSVEAKAFLDEGYRALSMLHIVWPALARGYSRAALIEPKLEPWIDDPRVRRFRMRDPHDALTQIRHRLCDERAGEDLRVLGAAITRISQAKPGRSLDQVASIYDLKTCDPPRKKEPRRR